MERSGLQETISTRWKSLPERSRIAGSVKGKSIIVPRISYLFLLGIDLAASYHYSAAPGGSTPRGRAPEESNPAQPESRTQPESRRLKRSPRLDSFPLQKGLIFERMPLTAEVPVSRPRWLGFPDCP